ncbi:MAG: dihydroorotate dehydrogenase [Microthrixaceae bacterium]
MIRPRLLSRHPQVEGCGEVQTDLGVEVGSIGLPTPVMVASGTVGHATELASTMDLSRLGAFVVKSLAATAWPGNPAPRVHPTPAGMINSVGLQGPGVRHWLQEDLPDLRALGVHRVVVSIWGRTVEEYGEAAEMLADAPREVIAVEVNLSCPNLDGGRHLFAHDPAASAEVLGACTVAGRPRWAKLSPNTDRLVEVAGACRGAGAEAVTLTNTLLGMVIDVETRRPALGAGGGGVSGRAMHPVAVRAVYDCAAAHPDLPIVGVGGISSGVDAVELMMAGATAVQVGTAHFADPRAADRITEELADWCRTHRVGAVRSITGAAHER